MKRINLGKTLSAAVWIGGPIISASALADTQQGGSGYRMGPGMMDGYYGFGWMGGYGGLPILLVIVLVGVVAWAVAQKRK